MKRFLPFILVVLLAISAYAGETWIDGYEAVDIEVAQWNGMDAPSVSPTNTGRIYYDSTGDTLNLSLNSGAYSPLVTVSSGSGLYLKLDCSNDPLLPTNAERSLHIAYGGDDCGYFVDTYSTNADDYSRARFRKSNHNTVGTLAETNNLDYLGVISFEGCNTTPAFAWGPRIIARQIGAAGAYVPSSLTLEASSNAGANTNQLVLATTGNVGIGILDPLYLLDVAEIGNSAGDLKIMPDVQGDVVLFEDTDVADDADGKSLYVHRKAAEGDTEFQFYIDQYRNCVITNNGLNISLETASNIYTKATGELRLQSTAGGNIVCFGDTDVDNAADGKSLYVYRKAAEGDSYIKQNIDQYGHGYITFNSIDAGDDLKIENNSGGDFLFNSNVDVTGTLGAGATTVTSLDAGSGAITTTGDIRLRSDSNKIEIGDRDGGDLEIYHDGTNNYLNNKANSLILSHFGAARLNFDGSLVKISDEDGEIVRFNENNLNMTNGGTITTTGTGTFGTLDVTGAATLNSSGGDNDFLIKANDVDNQFRIDAGTNTVNIGNVTPSIAYTWLGEGRTGAGGGGAADDGGGMRFDAGAGYAYTSGAVAIAGDGGKVNFFAGAGGAVSGATVVGIGGPGGEARMHSGDGGASSGSATVTQTGGNAGDFYFYSGDGGKGTNSVGASTGGQAGDFQLISGGGGDADGTGTINTGGKGADVFFTAGAGGDATNGATSNTGGAGGCLQFSAGSGGTGATANGADGTIDFKTDGSNRWRINGDGDLISGTDGTGDYDITTAGNITIDSDSSELILGDGQDVGIGFDNADLIVNSKNITANDEVHFTNFDGVDLGSSWLTTTGTLGAGAITGTSLTDGTLTIDDGSITDAVNGTFSGTLQTGNLAITGYIDAVGGDLAIYANTLTLDLGLFELSGCPFITNSLIRLQTYITAADAIKYVQLQVKDSTDYLEFTREDANILGLDIQMPLITDDITMSADLVATPDEITATSEGVAASITTVNTEVTTNGNSDLDNVTLANGTSGQIKHIYCVVEGNAADTWKITPATMCGGIQITFTGAGEGCTLVYADNEGWVVVANNGGTIT